MAMLKIDFRGKCLDKATSLNVFVPEKPGRFPVLYLLHGLTGDFTSWDWDTCLRRHVGQLPLIVVMPEGHRSYYCNGQAAGGLAYEDHIVRDVVTLVDEKLPTIPTPGARALAGLSMGGYGAAMLAMRHPDVFSVAVSHSGAFWFGYSPEPEGRKAMQLYSDALAKEYSIFAIARRYAKGGPRRLALRLDCGTEDFLIRQNRDLHALLNKLSVPHQYAEHPGCHSWDYWEQRFPEGVEFVMKNLKIR